MRYEEITEESLCTMVDRFYEKVRADSVLGPIFNERITDWGPHLSTMYDFWHSVILARGRYKGSVMSAHIQIPQISPDNITRWLALFRETTEELFIDSLAWDIQAVAERIAKNIELGHAFYQSRLKEMAQG
ncbi:group III truncated hemoglobin [Telmatospirillum sp. J64-1]|uniref:group III truncated hemoglobin n=1 Tax=Telmatospirillum sp. J64-1 TaxID=2502183 RepID=UPI00115DA4F0|nr:group III truncated hemoglobin [Telmatospirillum sp. J64-1]